MTSLLERLARSSLLAAIVSSAAACASTDRVPPQPVAEKQTIETKVNPPAEKPQEEPEEEKSPAQIAGESLEKAMIHFSNYEPNEAIPEFETALNVFVLKQNSRIDVLFIGYCIEYIWVRALRIRLAGCRSNRPVGGSRDL